MLRKSKKQHTGMAEDGGKCAWGPACVGGGVCVGDFGASQQRRFANALIERWVMPIRLWARAGGGPRTRLTLFFFFFEGGGVEFHITSVCERA